MIDVLMIVLQFAPVQSTGAYRSIEFAKRLPAHGIRPTVLTIDPMQASSIFNANINPSLSEGLPEEIEIRYLRDSRPLMNETPLAQLWRMLSTFDDTFERRFAAALHASLTELQEGKRRFAAVYASAPPFGASMLGMRAALSLKLPYLLDMRDAWAQWSPGPQITRLHYARKQRDEAQAFAAATRIVGVTPELTELFSASHPSLPRTRFHTITNGVEGAVSLPSEAVWADTSETMDIGYVGSFYWVPPKSPSLKAPHRYLQYNPGTEDWSYRTPLPFFRAWAEIDRQAPDIGARLRFHHVGQTPDWLMPMASEYGLADRCICHGPMPRQEIAEFLEGMTGLLGTSMKRIGGFDYCLASKSFEYLASGKPTLAFVCPGAQRRFFEEVGGAMIFDPDDLQASVAQLREISGQTCRLAISKEALLAYDHDRIAEQMAALMRETAGQDCDEGGPDAA